MTLKVDQGHWQWHSSVGHISLKYSKCIERVQFIYNAWLFVIVNYFLFIRVVILCLCWLSEYQTFMYHVPTVV